jgi:hypothetical protein
MIGLALLAIVIIGGQADVAGHTDKVSNQIEWCVEHGGEAENRLSLAHGGLHCYLDGMTVHLESVTKADYPEPEKLTGISGATHQSTPLIGLGLWPFVFGIGILSSTVLGYQALKQ